MSARTDDKTETWWCNRSHAAPFYLAFLLITALAYSVWFSIRIYPLIPFSFGGGKPLTIEFFEGDKRLPDEIKKPDSNAKRSIPYRLLLTTDKDYFVVSPTSNEQSLEVNRESVAGIVVLR